jgi:hypothetical protein
MNRPVSSLTIHPAAAAFPLMPAAARAALVDSVRANGVQVPVAILAGTNEVIDGRHRVEAARAVGIESVPVVEVSGDAQNIALALNIDRRVTTPSQRAALAVTMMGAETGREARAAWSRRFSVSTGMLANALRLRNAGVDLSQVIAGVTSVGAALIAAGLASRVVANPAPAPVVTDEAPAPAPAPVVIVPAATPENMTAAFAAAFAAFTSGASHAEFAATANAADSGAFLAFADFLFNAGDILTTRA